MKPKQKKLLLSALGITAAWLVIYFSYLHMTYVSTDNAQVGAHTVMLSSRVAGTIQKVFIEENQKVKAGDVLAQIDTSDFSNANAAAAAQVSSLEARYREAEVNYKRATDLLREQAIPRERYDEAVATYKELGAKLKAAQAQAEQASLNVSYTKIVAPQDGKIGRKSVEPGQFVPAGQPLFSFVAAYERWINANLKETEIANVHPGAKVHVSVDAISDKSFEGLVDGIGPATGAIFSLLPPDNATGNFTKVVQRVPVRIKLVGLTEADIDRLNAGLSAVVDIRVR